MMYKSRHPHAFVLSRDYLMYALIKFPPNTYYVPSQTEDATFLVDYKSMVKNKKFPYIKQFNCRFNKLI